MTTRTVVSVLERTAQLIQRSNQWTTGSYEERNTDNQGKTRTCRCLAGAVRVAVGLPASPGGGDSLNVTKLTRRTAASLLKTLEADPENFGLEVDSDGVATEGTNSVEDFNDTNGVTHADVLRLVNTTVARIQARG